MLKISDMDWAQHIKMDYAQNLRRNSEMAKKDPHKIIQGVAVNFTVLQYQEFAVISSNLIKTENLKNVLAPWAFDLTK